MTASQRAPTSKRKETEMLCRTPLLPGGRTRKVTATARPKRSEKKNIFNKNDTNKNGETRRGVYCLRTSISLSLLMVARKSPATVRRGGIGGARREGTTGHG